MLKDGPASNLQFVEIIQRHPCLYDYKRPDYGKREACEKAWLNIANQVSDTVTRCKEKWKNLRTAFSRSIKKAPPGSTSLKRGRDYYLKDSMDFLLPFIKPKIPFENILQDSDTNQELNEFYTDAESSSPITVEVDLHELAQEEESVKEVPATVTEIKKRPLSPPIIPTTPPTLPKIKKRNVSDEADYPNPMQSLLSVVQSNPDLDFLKSLLPDMAKMNDYQKRHFKRKTLELIDAIVCDGPQTNNKTD